MSKTTALAEHKEKVTPDQMISIVKSFVQERFSAAKAQAKEATRNVDQMCGGQTEKLDREVVEQGRSWATRLAIIARRSAGTSYTPSRSSVAIQAVVKKIYAAIGELEAIVANDIEIPLFSDPKGFEQEFFGDEWVGLKKLKAKDIVDNLYSGKDEERQRQAKDAISEAVGEKVGDEVDELLQRYEIELPPPEEEAKPAKTGRARRAASRVAAQTETAEGEPEDDDE